MPCALVLSPLLPPGASLPYYHPAVRHLAFRFVPCMPPILCIEAVVLPNTHLDLNSRLYRTASALLETLHRYGWGAMTHFQKRVKHDCMIPRETYQDLYLVMRERYKHLVAEWKESTDPLKHVFEVMSMIISCESTADGWMVPHYRISGSRPTSCFFGNSLTRVQSSVQGMMKVIVIHLSAMYPASTGRSRLVGSWTLGTSDIRIASSPHLTCIPTYRCGNGLLTHILISEGYHGHGIDLRARTSWGHYPEHTRAALHVHAIDPTQYVQSVTENRPSAVPYLQPGAFLIGNHADELTPWLPLIATVDHASGYLSIPCCAWSFDERFARASTITIADLASIVEDDAFVDRLNLGSEGGHQSRYSTYRIWLAKLSQWMGWKVECDTLRIPSTRNWAIIGTSICLRAAPYLESNRSRAARRQPSLYRTGTLYSPGRSEERSIQDTHTRGKSR